MCTWTDLPSSSTVRVSGPPSRHSWQRRRPSPRSHWSTAADAKARASCSIIWRGSPAVSTTRPSRRSGHLPSPASRGWSPGSRGTRTCRVRGSMTGRSVGRCRDRVRDLDPDRHRERTATTAAVAGPSARATGACGLRSARPGRAATEPSAATHRRSARPLPIRGGPARRRSVRGSSDRGSMGRGDRALQGAGPGSALRADGTRLDGELRCTGDARRRGTARGVRPRP